MPHTFDTSELPFISATFSGDITAAIINDYQSNLMALFDRGVRFVMALETFDVGHIDRSTISTHSSFYKVNAAVCARHWLGVGLVLRSPATRFMLSSLLMLAPLPMPYRVVRSVAEAQAFAAHQLLEAGIPLPRPLEPFRRA